ncbi:hypothetical protein G6027_14575 [Dietzia sp. SLG310A2-38A2]|uniref:hypothetical protein n=1 Tax=Dietzia sp. SLG310A2-38A2 TaxID=1630643 RepID=UPI0015FB396B|nr:hypothetical protein [Dietzia sp. SLG310A2-38A2]MBB1032082.1 hypothetical protein [Dietzia sp. SLG310A2-38A2]
MTQLPPAGPPSASPLPSSLGALRTLFTQATPAATLPAPGDYLVTYVGPAPLKVIAPRAITMGGMPGWRGKRFASDGTAVNLLDDGRGSLREALPMRATLETSWLDGRPTIVCSYGPAGPVPWRWVRDEFRALDDRRLLGLTFVGGPWSRIAAAPLLLTRS